LTDAQEAYARSLVQRGDYSSLSAVLQRGLDLLRRENEKHETELELMRTLIDQRRQGPFISMDELESDLKALRKRRTLAAI
jgi:antitoxin ParD1/3/4